MRRGCCWEMQVQAISSAFVSFSDVKLHSDELENSDSSSS